MLKQVGHFTSFGYR